MTTPTTGAPTSNVPFTGDIEFDALIEAGSIPGFGVKWGGALGTPYTITYSFPTSPVNAAAWSSDPLIGYATAATQPTWEPWNPGFSELTSAQKAAVTQALIAWSNVANISFTQVADNASVVGDIRVANTGMDANLYAYTYTPVSNAPYAGDVWINAVQPVPSGNDYSVGANGWATVLHELGHAIGLDHPFSFGPGTFPDGLDSMQYTIMSYSDYDPPGPSTHFDSGDSSFYPTTPMLLDIQALQYLYGPNMTYNAGSDTYLFYQGDNYYQTLWDAGGTDTIQYIAASDGALIDLNAGQFSQLGNPIVRSDGTIQNDNVAIAFNVTIENAIGGGGNDTLIGNGAANMLDGGGGADSMSGGGGNDTFVVDNPGDVVSEQAGAGTDLVLSSISFTLGANLENLTLTGSGPINGTGNAAANAIAGNAGDNVLDGRGGSDLLAGGDGNDTYIVGVGVTVDESGTGHDTEIASCSVTLAANVEDLVLAGIAALTGKGNALDNSVTGNRMMNRLAGGYGNDHLVGDRGDDTLTGGAGNDTLEGGAGHDVLKGGAGEDVFAFTTASPEGRDVILDFTPGVDHIAVGFDIDNVRYDGSTGALYFDPDGAGREHEFQFALLVGAPPISESDFLL